MPTTQDALERIKTAAADLIWLAEEWDEEVEDDSLRRSSSVIRRLLVDGEVGQAWRALGMAKQPSVTAPSLLAFVAGVPIAQIQYAQTGGANHRGLIVSGTLEYSGALTPAAMQERVARLNEGITRDFSLDRFSESPCVIVNGDIVKRREVIKYVANKLGGVHPVDSGRDAAKAEDRQYEALDAVRGVYAVADKDAVYFELLSIGQCLVASPDIQGFIERA